MQTARYILARLAFMFMIFVVIQVNPLPLFQLITGAVTPNGGIPVSGQFGLVDAVMAVVILGLAWVSYMAVWSTNRARNRAIRKAAR